MDVLQAIHDRFSCRSYKADPVSSGVLMQLVDAARMAPSAMGLQPWEFVVVTDVSTLRELGKVADSGGFIAKAAACIVVFCRRETECAVEDGAVATENILIAATGLGLGACWVAGDRKPYADRICTLLRAPAELKLISLIAVGLPAVSPPADRGRRPLASMLHWQHF